MKMGHLVLYIQRSLEKVKGHLSAFLSFLRAFSFYFEPFLPINVLGNSLNFSRYKSDK
jgi:hypothetical protein